VKTRAKDFWIGALGGFVVLAGVIQFFRPARTNPPETPGHALEDTVRVPLQVEAILTRSCDDCHSDRTIWPWYTNVAPISWFIVHHVNGGRRHLNFSEWIRPDVQDPVHYTQQKFQSACKEVQNGGMPLSSYLLIHRDARLSAEDVRTICQWAAGGIGP
jgi:hypothetical protein